MILEIGGLVLYVAVALFVVVPKYRSRTRQKIQAAWPRVDALVKEHRLRVVKKLSGFAEYRSSTSAGA